IGFKPFKAMTSPDFRPGIDAAKNSQVIRRTATDQDNARSFSPDASKQGTYLRIRNGKIAINLKWGQRSVVVKQQDAVRSGRKSIQKRPVSELIHYLHAGSCLQQLNDPQN